MGSIRVSIRDLQGFYKGSELGFYKDLGFRMV